jgi:glucose-6-phosphate 1-dehydrogenase
MLVGASAADAEITACMVPFLLLPVMTGTRPDSDGDGVQIAHARSSEKTAPSDIVVVFGITGDLARLMTFRALYRLEERGLLNCPIVGVALDDWTTEQLVDHAHDSIVATGEPVDSDLFRRFAERLSYIAGDFTSDETYTNVGKAIEGAKRPLLSRGAPVPLRHRRLGRAVELDVQFASVGGKGPTAYEVLLEAAMAGDSSNFAREDTVDETWRVVQPLLDAPPPVQVYETGTWGPPLADELVRDHGGWYEPWLTTA